MLLLLLACTETPKPADPDGDDTGAPDSAPEDTDSGDTGPEDTDTGPEDTDTGEPAPVEGPRTGVIAAWDARWPDGYAGRVAPLVTDLDGDGHDELLFYDGRAREAFRLVDYDAYAGTLRERTVYTGYEGGAAAAVVDDQLFLRPDGYDRTFVFTGPPAAAETRLNDAPTWLLGSVSGVRGLPDLDGDGVDEIAVDYGSGTAIFAGPLPAGGLSREDARWDIDGYVEPTGGGDFDGDGHGDLLFGSEHQVVFGPIREGIWQLDDLAPVTLALAEDWWVRGVRVVGDSDGDGRANLLVETSYALVALHGVDREGPAVPDEVVEAFDNVDLLALRDDAFAMDLASNVVGVWHRPLAGASILQAPDLQFPAGSVADWVVAARLGAGVLDVLRCDDNEILVGRGWGLPGEDADRDGFAADDCDDADPAVHPAAAEVTDGVDQDCDGAVDDAADRVVTLGAPTVAGAWASSLGTDVAAWDDDGDGVASLVVTGGARERDYETLWVVPGGAGLDAATAELHPTDGETALAADLRPAVLGDLDGDGLDELGLATANLNGVRPVWILGGLAGVGELEGGPVRAELAFGTTTSDAGSLLAAAGDVDGDGLGDVLVGGEDDEGTGGVPAAVYLLLGSGILDGGEADASFTAEGPVVGARRGAPVGDLDGDGRDDVAFTTGRGVAVFTGVTTGAWAWDDARTVLDVADERLAVVDLDADGQIEVYVGGGERVTGFATPLAAGTLGDAEARAILSSVEGAGGFGSALMTTESAAGPLLLVGEPASAGNGLGAGRVWAFGGALTGALTTDAAIAGWQGGAPADRAGGQMTALEVDGVPTLVLGVPEWDGASAWDGAVFRMPLP